MQWLVSKLQAHPRRTAAAILAAALCLSFWQILFTGKTFDSSAMVPGVMGDGPHGYHYSKAALETMGFDSGGAGWQISAETRKVRNALRAGRMPWWNPNQMLGTPLVHNLQLSAFFPPRFLLLPFWTQAVADLYRLALFFAAGMGVYLLALQLRIVPAAALFSALAYMLSGVLAPFSAFSFIDLFALLPWLLWGTARVFQAPSRRTVILLSLFFAGAALSAYPGALIPIGLCVVAFALRCWNTRGAGAFALAALLGALIGSPMLLPALDNFRLLANTRHHGFGLEHYPLDAFVGLFLPHVVSALQAAPSTINGFAGWVGVFPFLFALLGLFSQQRVKYFFAGVVLVCVLKLAGLPPVQWLAHLPVLSQPMYVRYLLPILVLALAVLAGLGVERLGQGFPGKRAWLTAVGTALVLVLVFLVGRGSELNAAFSWRLGMKFLTGALWAVIFVALVNWKKRQWAAVGAVVLVGLELSLYHQRIYNHRHDPFEPAAYINFLREQSSRFRLFGFDNILFPPYASAFDLDDIRWMNALYPREYRLFINEFLSPRSVDRFTGEESPLFLFDEKNVPTRWTNLLGVRYLLAQSQRPLPLPRVFEGEGVAVYENKAALDRAFVVHKAMCFDEEERAVVRMRAPEFDPAKEVVLAGKKCPAFAMTNDAYESVPIVRYEDNLIELDVTKTSPGMLVLTDTYFEKWKAEIDGVATPIFRADLIFRAVQIPPGSKLVRFYYRDPLAIFSLWLSGLTLTALLVFPALRLRFFR